MKVIFKLRRNNKKKINEQEMQDVQTWGDLKRQIHNTVKRRKDEYGGEYVKKTLGNLLGIDLISNTFDFFKSMYNLPDNKRTNTFIDKLDVDDEMAKIVDEKVENAFLNYLIKFINDKRDDEPVDNSFEATREQQKFLANNYKGRTLTKGASQQEGLTNQFLRNIFSDKSKLEQIFTTYEEINQMDGEERSKKEVEIDYFMRHFESGNYGLVYDLVEAVKSYMIGEKIKYTKEGNIIISDREGQGNNTWDQVYILTIKNLRRVEFFVKSPLSDSRDGESKQQRRYEWTLTNETFDDIIEVIEEETDERIPF